MRIICLISILICFTNLLRAQDTLYKSDGTRQLVKVLEVNQNQVKYKLIANADGPVYVISKEDVLQIVYSSGILEVFPQKPVKNRDIDLSENTVIESFGRNFISINIADILFNSLTISYERTLKSGDYSFKFPLSIGLKSNIINPDYDDNGYYNKHKTFSIGLDFYFYPKGQSKPRFFFGPSLEYGQFNYLDYVYKPSGNPYQKEKGSFYAIIFENGFLFQPSEHFNITIHFGAGWTNVNSMYEDEQFTVRGGINVGYKF